MTAFRELWFSTGNATQAVRLIGFAYVIQVAGWDALKLRPNKQNGVRSVFARAGVAPESIEFYPPRTSSLIAPEEVERLQKEIESEFSTLAVNMRGRMYKKTQWRDRLQNIYEESDHEL